MPNFVEHLDTHGIIMDTLAELVLWSLWPKETLLF